MKIKDKAAKASALEDIVRKYGKKRLDGDDDDDKEEDDDEDED